MYKKQQASFALLFTTFVSTTISARYAEPGFSNYSEPWLQGECGPPSKYKKTSSGPVKTLYKASRKS